MSRFAVPVVVSLVLALFVGVPAASAAEPAAYACRQDIHPQDEDFPGVHVATLEEAPNGDLLYGFYAGSREGADDVKTYMGRLDAGAKTWTEPTVVFDEPDEPDGNAVFWTDDDNGLVHLLFSTIRGDGWTEADLRMITSADNGQTWSDPTFIREEWGWLFGTLPFRMSNGELIVPIYSETEWSSGFYISTDDAQTFVPYPNDDDTTWPTSVGGMIQPATVELEDGHLLAYNRSRDGFIWQTQSTDYGRTWSDAEPTSMPNNNSRLALLKLHNGNLVMAHNPTMFFGRSPLRLSLSTDGGATWSASVDVEAEQGEEFSYPYLLQTSDGMIQFGYTHRRETMRHIAFNEQFIVDGADMPSNPDPAVKAEFADGELADVQTCRYAVNPQLAPPTACPEGAVPSAGYSDTAGNIHEASIACVSWHDIALGTDADSYSPARRVSRAQMASFLARLIERAGGELPQVSGQRFDDVDDSNVHAQRIEQLAEAGIVSGTGESTYDPDGFVTRAQMATFLVRSYEFVTEQSIPGSRDHFTDDEGNDHEDNINRAVSAGFAAGFGDATYRPGERTRRDQMATYLTNTLERLARDGRVQQPS